MSRSIPRIRENVKHTNIPKASERPQLQKYNNKLWGRSLNKNIQFYLRLDFHLTIKSMLILDTYY